ncbi:hypothetical protein [Streptomyces inhibens]|uniref:hypothetical protein n=1 Tax=Streptomyces inhibens TaxID=2293571 RepID=UPI0015F2761B|nr:hypothetical protein [Streptomyces inhibens]
MPRIKHAIALVAFTVAIVGTAATPAMADRHRPQPADVTALDRHAPLTANLGAEDRHRP